MWFKKKKYSALNDTWAQQADLWGCTELGGLDDFAAFSFPMFTAVKGKCVGTEEGHLGRKQGKERFLLSSHNATHVQRPLPPPLPSPPLPRGCRETDESSVK